MHKASLKTARTASLIPPEVSALLSALHLNEPDTTPLMRLSNREWRDLLAFSDRAHLTLQIAQLTKDGFPDWVVERLGTNVVDNALRFERIKATYKEAAEALDRAGVEHVVFKGFTQSPGYVANPRLRAQSDIDIFCPPDSIEVATEALQAIGYESSDTKISYAFADHRAPLVRRGDWQWRGNPFDPAMPLGIELHFCFWNERVAHFPIPETDLFWQRRTMREVEGLSFACLSPVDHLAYLALHILRNIFLGDWIVHHVRELAVFLNSHAGDEDFWHTWNNTHSPSLRSLEAISFYFALAWFDCRLHPLASQQIESLSPTRQSWLQCFCDSALEVMFRKNKDALWLQLSFIDSGKKRWQVIYRSLFQARIVSLDSAAVGLRNKRLAPSYGNHRLRQYFAYLISRSAAHGWASLVTLMRGLHWLLSMRSLSNSFSRVEPNP